MESRKEYLFQKDQRRYVSPNVSVGEFTYGVPTVLCWEAEDRVSIGKFCSIAGSVFLFGGGEHRTDWATTYPFNKIFPEFSGITGHPSSKGPVTIGNDVWLASDCRILSGVTVGDGAVIGANALVTEDVPAYAIVGGNPAKVIRYRFDEETRKKLLEIKWWDWEYDQIFRAVPYLQSSDLKGLFRFYEEQVLPGKRA